MFVLLIACLLSEPTDSQLKVTDRIITTCPIAIYHTFHTGIFSFSLDFRVVGVEGGAEIVDMPFPELVGLFVHEKKLRECIKSWQIPKGEILDFTWYFGALDHGFLQWCDQKGHCTKVKAVMPWYNTKEALPTDILKKYLDTTEQ